MHQHQCPRLRLRTDFGYNGFRGRVAPVYRIQGPEHRLQTERCSELHGLLVKITRRRSKPLIGYAQALF
ncbi:hypothetical protein D3C71_1935230 [compost metagenome]